MRINTPNTEGVSMTHRGCQRDVSGGVDAVDVSKGRSDRVALQVGRRQRERSVG